MLWPFSFQLICIKHYVRSNSRWGRRIPWQPWDCHCHQGLGPGAKDAKLDATGWTRPLPWSGEGGSWLARLWGRSIRCSKRFRDGQRVLLMGDEVIVDNLEGCLPRKSCTKKIAWHMITVVWLQSADIKLTSLTKGKPAYSLYADFDTFDLHFCTWGIAITLTVSELDCQAMIQAVRQATTAYLGRW